MDIKGMKILMLVILAMVLHFENFGQNILINEVMASNVQTVLDEDGDTPDWIELLNTGSEAVDLSGYILTDDASSQTPWTFPDFTLQPGQHLLVFASDKNRKEAPLVWETVVDLADEWRYLVPQTEPDASWRDVGFDDSTWDLGKTSIGYGDGDDSTVVETTISVFLRKMFDLSEVSQIQDMILHADYDDGFIAYVNGVEIARSGLDGEFPAYDATAASHESVMHSGGQPEAFSVSNFENILLEGENVICIQVHNTNATSSDMTIIPILSIGSTVDRGGEFSDYITLSQASFHTDFKIASGGDTLMLFDSNSQMLDSIFTGNLRKDISLGRSPDGGDTWAYFDQSTPGEANNTESFEGISAEVMFSIEGGIYSESQNVELTPVDGTGDVFFTIDGSIPTTESTIYSGEISIQSAGVIRARVIEDGSMPGPIKSASYLIGLNHDLPIVSIAADPFEFFDETYGMYMLGPNASSETPNYGANFWEEWEREVHVEMYETDGSQVFSANAGAKIFGAYSRANAQKSLSLFFRKSYGDGPIEYQLFEEKELDKFSSIVLRNSGNDWNNTMMRDGLLTSLFHTSVDRQGYRPAVLYINGEYFGIQNIREKINEHFIANNHAISSSDVEILETNTVPVYGNEEHYRNLISFVENNSLTQSSNYEYVQTQMDVMNFIYYMTGNIFINNQDWPGNNIKFWREGSETGKWKWIAFDTDFGFGIWDAGDYVENTLSFALETNGPNWPNPPWSTLLLRRLIENEEFRNLFINTYADQLNTTWRTSSVEQQIDTKSKAIENEISSHMSRWGGNYNNWLNQIDNYFNYAVNRPAYARQHILNEFGISGSFDLTVLLSDETHGTVEVNTLSPQTFPWTGSYMNNVPVRLKAIPNAGYRFLGWVGYAGDENEIWVNASNDIEIRAVFERVDGAEKPELVINEINYNSSPELEIDDWVELYNAGVGTLDLTNWTLKDGDDEHSFVFPEGSVLLPNEYLVVCRNVDNFLSSYSNVSDYIGDLDFGLGSTSDCVRIFDSKDVLVSSVCYESTSPWPEAANGTGATLALKNTDFDQSNAVNWYAQSNSGTPGRENVYTGADAVTAVDKQLTEYELVGYPNPFNNSVIIQYQVRTSEKLAIVIYDMQGRLIKELVKGNYKEGRYSIEWRPDDSVKKGIYISKIIGQDGTEFSRLVYY